MNIPATTSCTEMQFAAALVTSTALLRREAAWCFRPVPVRVASRYSLPANWRGSELWCAWLTTFTSPFVVPARIMTRCAISADPRNQQVAAAAAEAVFCSTDSPGEGRLRKYRRCAPPPLYLYAGHLPICPLFRHSLFNPHHARR